MIHRETLSRKVKMCIYHSLLNHISDFTLTQTESSITVLSPNHNSHGKSLHPGRSPNMPRVFSDASLKIQRLVIACQVHPSPMLAICSLFCPQMKISFHFHKWKTDRSLFLCFSKSLLKAVSSQQGLPDYYTRPLSSPCLSGLLCVKHWI